MIEGVVGKSLLFELALTDGNASVFPLLSIYREDGTFQTSIAMVLVPGTAGLYRALWISPFAAQYAAHFEVFTDAGHTTGADGFDRVPEHVIIRALEQDDAFTRVLGHLGENVRDDVLTYDLNNRPTAFRRRIFPDAATTAASTPGSTGEGEILTITGSALHFDAARWMSLVRAVTP